MSELIVDASKDNLKEVFTFVTNELSGRISDKKQLRQIKLCVEEIFINISEYAYNPQKGDTKISIKICGEPEPMKVIVSFIDHGRPFDPLKAAEPDLESGIEEREIGGLGIFLVKNTADGITYEYQDGQNILTIEKTL